MVSIHFAERFISKTSFGQVDVLGGWVGVMWTLFHLCASNQYDSAFTQYDLPGRWCARFGQGGFVYWVFVNLDLEGFDAKFCLLHAFVGCSIVSGRT